MVPLPDLTPFPDTGSPPAGLVRRSVISGAAVTRHPNGPGGCSRRSRPAGWALLPLEVLRRVSPVPRRQCLWRPHHPSHSVLPTCGSVSTFPYVRTQVVGVGPQLQQDLVLVIASAETYFQIRSRSEVLGVGTTTLGDRARRRPATCTCLGRWEHVSARKVPARHAGFLRRLRQRCGRRPPGGTSVLELKVSAREVDRFCTVEGGFRFLFGGKNEGERESMRSERVAF